MKVLSLHQPWASLVAWGEKRIETRSWRTSLRGPLAIHASKGKPAGWPSAYWSEPFRSVLQEHGVRDLEQLPRGMIIATVNVLDCVPSTRETPGCLALQGARLGRHEEAFGDFSDGRWLWILSHPRPLLEPIPATGSQGIWTYEGRCDALRGPEGYQPSCSLPLGHEGPHSWSEAVSR